MTERAQGYSVGVPKPKRQIFTAAWEWLKQNWDILLRILLIAAFFCSLFYIFGAIAKGVEESHDNRVDCYSSGGEFAHVGFGDDLCYRDGKVWRVYQS